MCRALGDSACTRGRAACRAARTFGVGPEAPVERVEDEAVLRRQLGPRLVHKVQLSVKDGLHLLQARLRPLRRHGAHCAFVQRHERRVRRHERGAVAHQRQRVHQVVLL